MRCKNRGVAVFFGRFVPTGGLCQTIVITIIVFLLEERAAIDIHDSFSPTPAARLQVSASPTRHNRECKAAA
jgi:hypothetical protein